MKELKTGSIASVVVRFAYAGCLILSGACAISSGDEPDQPIAYNHKLHIETVGLECAECHRYVETSAAATLPPPKCAAPATSPNRSPSLRRKPSS